MSKVEQWLDTAEAPLDSEPPVSEPPSPAAPRPGPLRRRLQPAAAALLPNTPLAVSVSIPDDQLRVPKDLSSKAITILNPSTDLE